MFRPPSSSFDSALRSRYFPGGPTPDGLESDMMFKSLAGETDQLRGRRESEGEMMTDNRYRMTPPESPRERDGANHSSDNVMAIDINQRDQGRLSDQ